MCGCYKCFIGVVVSLCSINYVHLYPTESHVIFLLMPVLYSPGRLDWIYKNRCDYLLRF